MTSKVTALVERNPTVVERTDPRGGIFDIELVVGWEEGATSG